MTRLTLASLLVATGVAAGGLAGSASSSTSVGAPPPELTQFSNQWPAHNLNVADTRSTTAS